MRIYDIIIIIKKIYNLLSKKQAFQLNVIFFFCFITFILEFLSLSSLPIFVSSLLDPEYLSKILYLNFNISFEKISNKDLILITGSAVLIIFTIKNLFLLFLIRHQSNYFEKLKSSLSKRFFNYYINSPYQYYINENPSSITRTLSSEIQGIYGYINNLTIFLREIFAIVSIIILLSFANSIAVFLLSVFFIILTSVYLFFVKPKLRKASKNNQSLLARNIKMINETFNSFKDIKISENEKQITEVYKGNIESYEKNLKLIYIVEKLPKIILEVLSIILIIFITIILFKNFEIQIIFSNLALLLILIVRFIPAFNGIATSLAYLKIFQASVNLVSREFDKMYTSKNNETKSQNYKFNNENKKEANNFFLLEDLSFRYGENDDYIFKNLNLNISKGDRVAVIGSTGSGKSTLMYLMLGLLKPTKGNIFFENENIEENLSNWRKKLSYISQNNFLYDDTIEENITLANLNGKKLNKVKLEKVISMSSLDQKIKTLDDGVKSSVGNNGIKLSGGEKQRLCIARALYKDTDFFFMDEFTSALDNKTENIVFQNILNNYPDSTFIIISHRENTIKNCNKIINLNSFK